MDNSIKKAVTYSLLAHIRNSGTLTKGPLDVFIPIVKKGLHQINQQGLYKGESIVEIKIILEELYGIDFPIPVLRNILLIIAKEINTKEETSFVLNNDNSFWIKDYVFEDYDSKLKEYQKEINKLQKLFSDFCKANGIDDVQNNCIIKFIEKNKVSISKYLANTTTSNGKDFIIEARFVEYFRNNSYIFSLIKNIYLGSILTCYLEYQPVDVRMNVTLLFDTNFIISLLDLNTPESTHTCIKLIEICKKFGYEFKILNDTIDETRNLLNSKANNYDSAIILRYVNKEDIYNACERRNLSRTDLDRIADNLEKIITDYGIYIIPHTESLKNKAKFSPEYSLLKNYRNSEKAALHDASAIIYVKEKRGKKVKEFENVNCWFVNNSISHDNEEGINPLINPNQFDYQPELIKVDDLLNVLWLSNPSINNSLPNDELVDIGLTSLVAATLNEALPKARIIKELDVNIQKYKDDSVTDKDVLLLSTRIANGQVKNIERLNEIAKTDPTKFNEGIRKEARKQEKVENERNEKFEELLKKFNDKYEEIGNYKEIIDNRKQSEIDRINQNAKKEIEKRDSEIELLRIELITKENEKIKIDRDLYIKSVLRTWRRKSWIILIITLLVLLLGVAWLIISMNNLPESAESFFDKVLKSKFLSILFSIVTTIINYFVIRLLYDKYHNHSNINAFKLNITIPDELKEKSMK